MPALVWEISGNLVILVIISNTTWTNKQTITSLAIRYKTEIYFTTVYKYYLNGGILGYQ